MKVGILTMFNGLERTYSLVNVVAEHIRMLLDDGIAVKLLVCEDINESEKSGIYLDPRIEWVKVCNRYQGEQLHWRDYSSPQVPIHSTLLEEARVVGEDLIKKLKDVDVCMMHDIHYQGWHLLHNLAVRYASQYLPHLRFIAMTHSMPDTTQVGKHIEWPHSARYTPMPNTVYAYPTACGLEALSRQYQVSRDKCYVINNTLDLFENMREEVRYLYTQVDFISPDILMVYPARFTEAKQFEKIVILAAAIKRVSALSVKVIFCEFPASDTPQEQYKSKIRNIATQGGLTNEEVIFTSDYGFTNGLNRNAVLDLFTLSNLYICPSFAESFGLTVLEAASRGNFIVLNKSVPALRELGESIEAYFMNWDARGFDNIITINYTFSEEDYNEAHAKQIISEIRKNKILVAKTLCRQRYSPKWVFENQLKPLLLMK